MRWGQPLRRARTVLAAVLAAGMAVSALTHRAPWLESTPDTRATLVHNVGTPIVSDDFDSSDRTDEDEISAADAEVRDVAPPADLH